MTFEELVPELLSDMFTFLLSMGQLIFAGGGNVAKYCRMVTSVRSKLLGGQWTTDAELDEVQLCLCLANGILRKVRMRAAVDGMDESELGVDALSGDEEEEGEAIDMGSEAMSEDGGAADDEEEVEEEEEVCDEVTEEEVEEEAAEEVVVEEEEAAEEEAGEEEAASADEVEEMAAVEEELAAEEEVAAAEEGVAAVEAEEEEGDAAVEEEGDAAVEEEADAAVEEEGDAAVEVVEPAREKEAGHGLLLVVGALVLVLVLGGTLFFFAPTSIALPHVGLGRAFSKLPFGLGAAVGVGDQDADKGVLSATTTATTTATQQPRNDTAAQKQEKNTPNKPQKPSAVQKKKQDQAAQKPSAVQKKTQDLAAQKAPSKHNDTASTAKQQKEPAQKHAAASPAGKQSNSTATTTKQQTEQKEQQKEEPAATTPPDASGSIELCAATRVEAVNSKPLHVHLGLDTKSFAFDVTALKLVQYTEASRTPNGFQEGEDKLVQVYEIGSAGGGYAPTQQRGAEHVARTFDSVVTATVHVDSAASVIPRCGVTLALTVRDFPYVPLPTASHLALVVEVSSSGKMGMANDTAVRVLGHSGVSASMEWGDSAHDARGNAVPVVTTHSGGQRYVFSFARHDAPSFVRFESVLAVEDAEYRAAGGTGSSPVMNLVMGFLTKWL